MSHLLDIVDTASLRSDVPAFRPGDTVNVHVRVIEGNRSRVQQFKGVVIRRQGAGVRETFTVRKVSFSVGVERTFPVHTPIVEKISSSPVVTCVAPSSTTCASCAVRPRRSRRSARTDLARESTEGPDSIWPRWTPKHSRRSATAPPALLMPRRSRGTGGPEDRSRFALVPRAAAWLPGGRITLTALLCLLFLLLLSNFVAQPFQIPEADPWKTD
ncbi:hypothetical protein SALBM311S_04614 [Streptomyces alboniger]